MDITHFLLCHYIIYRMHCPKILLINTSSHVLKKLLLPITLNWVHHGFNAWFTYLNHQCTRNTSVWDYNETSQPGHLANWNLFWTYCEAICLLQRCHITSYNIVITSHGVCMLLRWFTVVSWCGMAVCIRQPSRCIQYGSHSVLLKNCEYDLNLKFVLVLVDFTYIPYDLLNHMVETMWQYWIMCVY